MGHIVLLLPKQEWSTTFLRTFLGNFCSESGLSARRLPLGLGARESDATSLVTGVWGSSAQTGPCRSPHGPHLRGKQVDCGLHICGRSALLHTHSAPKVKIAELFLLAVWECSKP